MTYRPLFHFTAERGWINDPNGLCFYKGKYHLFYQYNPHSTEWGKMHWGHAISSDLVNWEHLDIALSPDEWYEDDERGGCFSGSAMVIGDRLYLMYTATAGGKQRQCIAYSDDGLNFTKYDKNPIIEPPEGIHEERDPYIFRLHDRYLSLVGMPGKIELIRPVIFSPGMMKVVFILFPLKWEVLLNVLVYSSLEMRLSLHSRQCISVVWGLLLQL